ncbi:MAG: hypothetical protein WD601_05460, partial [Pseudohongiellaceae bacterium]
MDRFPERIDSQRIFASNGLIQGEVPVAALPRLGEYLSRPGGLVQVDLQFGHDDQRRRILSGTLDVTVVMQCQHCLEDVDIRLQPIIALRIVSTDVEARQLP